MRVIRESRGHDEERERGDEDPGASRRLDPVRVGLLVLAGAVHFFVAGALAASWGTEEIVRRDYAAFLGAGSCVVEGDVRELYAARPGGFPFLHPPYVATLSAPLSLLSPRSAYVALTLLTLLALACAVAALRRFGARGEHDVLWLGLLASAPWAIALLLGQPALVLVAAWLAGLAALARGRELGAGLALSLLLLKPHFALAPIAAALLTRRWRVLAGLASGALVLFTLALPVGAWGAWMEALLRAGQEISDARVALWKQHTLLAFLRGVAPPAVAWIGWGAIALGLGARALYVALRVGPLRQGGILVLATLALAPYAYFYDAVLLVVPAAALWLGRARYPRRARLLLAGIVAATVVAEHVTFFVLQRGHAWPGLLVTLWLAAEVLGGPPIVLSDRSARTTGA